MKRKVLSVMLIAAVAVSTAVYTGQVANQVLARENTVTLEAQDTSVKTVEGTFTDKKDFMFTVVDDNGNPYGFFFGNGNAPEGYDSLNNGDRVVVEYTGDISEADAFEGKVISVVRR